MVPGFNTDFKYRGQTFHVQTEDNGNANPVVVSLLYHKGAILASRKTSYRELLDKPDCTERLKQMMKAQHKDLMRELLAGVYDAKLPVAAPAAGAAAAAAIPPAIAQAAAPAKGPAATPVPQSPLAQASAPRPTPVGLDEAIMLYLEEYAAAAAAH